MFQTISKSAKHRSSAIVFIAMTHALVSGGCNLGVELESYPYITLLDTDQAADMRPVLDMTPRDQDLADMSGEEMGPTDMAPDMPTPKVGVRLIFTEVMIKTSKRPTSASNELGEYIEITNIGDEPALMRSIQIRLDTASGLVLRVDIGASPGEQEQAQYNALSVLAPGEHFIFVKDDDEDFGITQGLALGSFFEWHWTQPSLALANTTRQLTLAYERPAGISFQDVIAWSGDDLIDQSLMMADEAYPVTQDVAFMLDERSYTAKGNDPTSAWCFAPTIIPGATMMRGTPGKRAKCPSD